MAHPKQFDLNEKGVEPIAKIYGQPLHDMPQDLYIPPDALLVLLETFEGPLDLLLYLIRKQNLEILDIPIAKITQQYMAYIDLMHVIQIELAAEYLVMAAILAEIKSRMLLPRPPKEDDEETDPRQELVRRLQEYEQIKAAATELDGRPRLWRDAWPAQVERPEVEQKSMPSVDLPELLSALQALLARVELRREHVVAREGLSVRERMSLILDCVRPGTEVPFIALFNLQEGRMGVVVTFLALLELYKQALIEILQTENLGPIYVRTSRTDS